MSDDKRANDEVKAVVTGHDPKTSDAATVTQAKPQDSVIEKVRNVLKPKDDGDGGVPAQFALPAQTESDDPWGNTPAQMRHDDKGNLVK